MLSWYIFICSFVIFMIKILVSFFFFFNNSHTFKIVRQCNIKWFVTEDWLISGSVFSSYYILLFSMQSNIYLHFQQNENFIHIMLIQFTRQYPSTNRTNLNTHPSHRRIKTRQVNLIHLDKTKGFETTTQTTTQTPYKPRLPREFSLWVQSSPTSFRQSWRQTLSSFKRAVSKAAPNRNTIVPSTMRLPSSSPLR